MPKMLLLPAQTEPANEPLARRHNPRRVQADYTVFRDCLRWEFGFTCAICLLHERDIMSYDGADGWGVMQIEHLVPRSQDDSVIGVYDNLIYICRLCNGARSDTPVIDDDGSRLLDPTKDIWASHFRLENDEVVPIEGDPHAAYTADVYAINEERKVRLRRVRRERTGSIGVLIRSVEEELAALMQAASRGSATRERGGTEALVRCRGRLDNLYRLRLSVVAEWVPEDAPKDCRCGQAHARSLPPPYLRQAIEIQVP